MAISQVIDLIDTNARYLCSGIKLKILGDRDCCTHDPSDNLDQKLERTSSLKESWKLDKPSQS